MSKHAMELARAALQELKDDGDEAEWLMHYGLQAEALKALDAALAEPIDIAELCATHNKIGYKQGYRAGAKDAREDCANLCEELGGTIYIGGRSQGADYCAAKIRERGVQ